MKMIKIIICLVFALLVSGCDDHITKELTCSKDMSKYFVGEANLKEGETSPYNRTVQTNFQFLYTEDEKEIKKVTVEYVASVTGENYSEVLERLSFELIEECEKRGFLNCESVVENNVYTISGYSDKWDKIEAYMKEFGQFEGSSIEQNKSALIERQFLCN